MSWRLAKSLEVLRTQVNNAYPERSKASDGTIGDTAHSGTVSDHNPDARGVVAALDLTHDLEGGLDCDALAEALRSSRDSRIKYVIWNGRAFEPDKFGWEWQSYYGSNPHSTHLHVSVKTGNYDNESPWAIGGKMIITEDEAAKELYRLGVHREPENDTVWRGLVGKEFVGASVHMRGSEEWLTQNHKIVFFDQQEQRMSQLIAEIESLKQSPDKAELESIKAKARDLFTALLGE